MLQAVVLAFLGSASQERKKDKGQEDECAAWFDIVGGWMCMKHVAQPRPCEVSLNRSPSSEAQRFIPKPQPTKHLPLCGTDHRH
jgi:hypothetical protein